MLPWPHKAVFLNLKKQKNWTRIKGRFDVKSKTGSAKSAMFTS